VGIFLPWAEASGSILGVHFSLSVSGLDVINSSGWDISDLALSDNLHAILVMIGAAIMIVCALPALFLSMSSGGGKVAVTSFGILISLGAVIAIAGLIWFFIDMSSVKNWTDYVGYGTYICGGGAVLGLIFGTLASVK
jgi:heme/copper-type cytochrome/quinol oxidase subunit 4